MTEQRSAEEAALVLFAAAMDALDVPYAVTGSTAMNFYAVPRMTRDIDVLIAPPQDSYRLIARVLSEDFEADPDVVLEALWSGRIFQVYTKGAPVKLDVIPSSAAISGPEMLDRAVTLMLDDQPVRVITPEDLILAKLYWARESESELQMRDIANLLGVPDLDLAYVDERARRGGTLALLRRIQGQMP